MTSLCIFITHGVNAQNSSLLPKPAKDNVDLVGNAVGSLEDIKWITGHWSGNAFGGEVDEIWSEAKGNAMMGMFRLVSEGTTSFYELMVIREVDNSLVLQLKHFHHNMKGWEEKDETVDFPLLKMEKNKVWFDGLTFEKISENQMIVNVIIDEDKPEGMNFIYYRQ